MRQLRFGVFSLFACVLALAGGAAYAAKPQTAAFKVTLTATLTKEWTFTRVETEADCTRTTRGTGQWEAKVSTRNAGTVRAVAAGRGRVRFSGAVLRALMGKASQIGTVKTTATGEPPCERVARSVRCARQRRSFRGGSTSLSSPRKAILRLGRLRGAEGIRSFRSGCPEEPSDIRAIRTDLPLALGPLDASDVFSRDVPRWFITGDSEQVTTIEGEIDGRVTERVRWTLTFRRLPG